MFMTHDQLGEWTERTGPIINSEAKGKIKLIDVGIWLKCPDSARTPVVIGGYVREFLTWRFKGQRLNSTIPLFLGEGLDIRFSIFGKSDPSGMSF